MKIDLELIKKKSEHNEGLMEDLEEISLHQLQIKKIEFINIHCKNLKILLLQNNLIEKIENLNQLKKLEYLNLAINNITVIENLEKCESLKKLDLTLNFIDLDTIEESIKNLQKNENLKEFYIMGNPCSNWIYLKYYIIFHIEQLQVLDGCDILISDRIKSKQCFEQVLVSLKQEIQINKSKGNEKNNFYSINNRKQIYEEIEKEEMEANKCKNENNEKKKKKEKKELSIYNEEGEIRQCNEGHYKFMFDEYSNKKYSFLKLYLPKYMCNSLIQIDLNICYVRCIIKDKLFQIKLNDPILTDLSKISRKKYTGELFIKMRKQSYQKNKIVTKEYSNDENVYSYDNPTNLQQSFLLSSTMCTPDCSSKSQSSSSSLSSSSSTSSSFFNDQYTYMVKNKNMNKKKKNFKSNLSLPHKKNIPFFLEEKQIKYFSNYLNQIPTLEKISKRNT
ncbi:leucine-rich repeat protein [Plasmodium gaboni]|uniref:Leucine-rich repeat protein n=1 Tax=Plasmodium gaboni TaxID=647221 RepID=A0ABY1UQC6_9APIC|nr:leucine-rich repeat protein [Plasmodium gaboni]